MRVVGTGVVQIPVQVVLPLGWNTVVAVGIGIDLVVAASGYTDAVAQ